MADAFTQLSSVTSDQAAYNRLAYFALRPLLHHDQVADVRATAQAMPGSSVVFQIYVDLSAASTALTETVDPDAVAMSDSQVTVTLTEYGNAVNVTAKLIGLSFLDVMSDASNVIGYNAGLSLDTIARAELVAGTNVRYGGDATSRVTVDAADIIDADDVRRARTDLVGASAMAWPDNYYRSIIHPDVTYDLRRETGAAAWRDPHTYSQPEQIWSGEIGAFEGFRFIESERGQNFVDGGATSSVDVYATLFLARQSLAKAFSSAVSAELPQVVQGPQVDKLRRFHPVGWYWLGGYKRFREACIRRLEAASSIGAN